MADISAWEKANITNIKSPALNPSLQCENGLLIRTMEQVIFPVSNMLLMAQELGIGACVIGALGSEVTGILPDVTETVKEKLGLGDKQIISSIITLGYDADNKETKKIRKSFEEVVSLEKIGNKF